MNWNKLLNDQRIRKSGTPKNDVRNPFDSDFGRIIFSPALRRMHDKTQVFPLTSDDNIHSRLTHSNEVMSIGYTFGLKLCSLDIIKEKTDKTEGELLRIFPVILKNVCLIHDIGNAPFGHFGETIVSNFFRKLLAEENKNFMQLDDHQKRDFINYDGNAQGLRVLTKLQILNDAFGLNLTYATLAAYLKYPNYEEINSNEEKKSNEKGDLPIDAFIEKSKHGVFFSEKAYFEKIITECGLDESGRVVRHPLCYLMEAADSIAYLTMDMEDGFNIGLVDLPYLKNMFKDNKSWVGKKIVETCDDKFLNDNTKIVNIRIMLIEYLVNLAFTNFSDNLPLIEKGKYNVELIKDDEYKISKILQNICNEKIFVSREINFLETTGYSVFTGLLNYYITFLFHEDKKYRGRALSLISKSVIDCAIEESFAEIASSKLQKELLVLNEDVVKYNRHEEKVDSLKNEINEVKTKLKEVEVLLVKYKILDEKQLTNILSKDEKNDLAGIKAKLKELIKPNFNDLSVYYKFRVILDFISGMTDQYALNHFQKISGQKIN